MDGANHSPGDSNHVTEDQTVEIDPLSTVLDVTSFQLHYLDSIELSPGLTETGLTANRLSKLDQRIAHLSNFEKLSLRQNLIVDAAIEPFSAWEELSALEVMENLQNLTTLQELWLG